MNEILLIVEIVLMFSSILILKRLFCKEGLFLWIGLASVLANIQVVKGVDMFGFTSAAGNVLFASVFLATDLLRECYGKEAARKGVYIGISSVVVYLICTQLTLLYVPNSIDISQSAMQTLFSFSGRVCIASLLMYAVANLVDVFIYDKMYTACKGKHMWLRNNVATIVCNSFENFGFAFLAFAGVYPIGDILLIAISGCAIEIGIALCDTPFLYWGKKLTDKNW